MQPRLRGQYNGKWPITLVCVSRPLVTVITAIETVTYAHIPHASRAGRVWPEAGLISAEVTYSIWKREDHASQMRLTVRAPSERPEWLTFSNRSPRQWRLQYSAGKTTATEHLVLPGSRLRTVPTIVIAHTFCASPDTRNSYRQYLLIQGSFCAV